MQLLPRAFSFLDYHFRAILCNTPCFGGKLPGILLDHVGNNGRLAFNMAEVNNWFRDQLSCQLNVK